MGHGCVENKVNKPRRKGLKRLDTAVFEELRSKEAKQREVGHIAGGAWNKMAIAKIHRRNQEPTVRWRK